MYAYTVKILGDDLNVRTTGQPKDWAATWTLSEIDSGLELSVGIDDEDGDAYVYVSINDDHSCQLDLGINLNTLEPMVNTMTQNGLACNVQDTIVGDDGRKIITVSTEMYDDGQFDCRQKVVGAAGLPCVPTMMMTMKQEPASCKICEAVYEGYKTIISKENVTVAALENLGQTMCHTFDLFGKTQDQVCDIIINATSEIREAIVKGVTPDSICGTVLSTLNITCA